MGEAKRKQEQFRAVPRSCAYCGAPATTKDHVPPKSIFAKPYPKNLVTVRACERCNAKWSKFDDRFRFGLNLFAGIDTPETAQLWRNHTMPSLRNNERLRREIVDQLGQPLWLPNPRTGRFEEGHPVRWPVAEYHIMIERITRGLYAHEFHRILPPECPVSVSRHPHFQDMRKYQRFYSARRLGRQFEYAFFQAEDGLFETLWMYIFQGQECAMAATGMLAE